MCSEANMQRFVAWDARVRDACWQESVVKFAFQRDILDNSFLFYSRAFCREIITAHASFIVRKAGSGLPYECG